MSSTVLPSDVPGFVRFCWSMLLLFDMYVTIDERSIQLFL